MRVIEIKKTYRNGIATGRILVDDDFTEDDIKSSVENWSEHEDGGGHAYGYGFTWSEIKDVEVLVDLLEKEKKKITGHIDYYIAQKLKIENLLEIKREIVIIQNIEKWIESLRSGKYKQIKNQLQRPNGHCCLGVACDIFISLEKRKPDTINLIQGTEPADQPAAPQWLKDINHDFFIKTDVHLTGLNDIGLSINDGKNGLGEILNKPYTFDEIADMLQMVYVLKVLN